MLAEEVADCQWEEEAAAEAATAAAADRRGGAERENSGRGDQMDATDELAVVDHPSRVVEEPAIAAAKDQESVGDSCKDIVGYRDS